MSSTKKKLKRTINACIINEQTGETRAEQLSVLEESDFGFHKVWASYLSAHLSSGSTKKPQLFFFLVSKMNSENVVLMTHEEMANATGITPKTVRTALKELSLPKHTAPPAVVRKHSGYYIVNPDIIFKGGSKSRDKVIEAFYLETNKASKKRKTPDKS